MKQRIKALFVFLLTRLWLRPGKQRRGMFGPYRGITFDLSPLMIRRLDVFYRTYENNVTDWLNENIRPGMTVYVVGAHIGIHVLYIAKRLDSAGKIIALEGWPENFESLKNNIALNPRPGVEVIPVQRCVAKESGRAKMAAGSSDGKHHLAAQGDAQTIEVQATSLDDYWRETTFAPDAILMDIEGYEADALEGARYLIQAYKPKLAIEHHKRDSVVKAWLADHGYTSIIVDKRHIFAQ